jgi:hypothetical protein
MPSITKRCKVLPEENGPHRSIKVYVLIKDGVSIGECESATLFGFHETCPLEPILGRNSAVFWTVGFVDALPGLFSVSVLHPHYTIGCEFRDGCKSSVGKLTAASTQERQGRYPKENRQKKRSGFQNPHPFAYRWNILIFLAYLGQQSQFEIVLKFNDSLMRGRLLSPNMSLQAQWSNLVGRTIPKAKIAFPRNAGLRSAQ